MGEYWTLEGMYDSKKKKKNKDKKYDEKEKKNKDKKKKSKEKDKNKNKTSNNIKRQETPDVYLPYSEFLKNSDKGLFMVKVIVGDIKFETYVIKSDEFEFPRVALSKSSDSYKDWLKKKLDSIDSELNVNKVLYASTVKRIDIPIGLLAKIIKNSGDED